MMAKKEKPLNPFTGRWRIVSMSAWEDEYLDEEVEAYIEFEEKGGGSFQFGYVQGEIDHRMTNRGGEPAVEFSWEGGDEADGTPLTGRGWAVIKDEELHGEFFIHDGDESEFVATRKKAPKGRKRQ
jgi:hypothetical protein